MDKLEKFKSVLKLLQEDTVTPQVLNEVISALIKIVKESKDNSDKVSQETKNKIDNVIAYLDKEHNKLLDSFTGEVSKLTKREEKMISKMDKNIKDMKAMCNELMMAKPEDGENGKDADEQLIIDKVMSMINIPEIKEETAEDIKTKLESLTGDNRLDASAIKNLPKGKGSFTAITGIKELVEGTGITIDNTNFGYPVISASGTSTDEKVKYDAGDPTAGYVADKIIAGTGISVAEGAGANENKLVITNTNPTVYTLPVATNSVLGGVKDGDRITIDANGIISADIQTVEGTAVLSTGEAGGTKFLREDGDGTSSWQAIPAAGGDVLGPATNTADYIPQWNGANSKTLKDGLAVPAGGLAGITALADKQDKFTCVAKTVNYTANPWEIISCDVSGGSFKVTLPSAPADKTEIWVKLNQIGLNKYLTLATSGTDKFNTSTGTVEIYMYLFGEYAQCVYCSDTGLWSTFISAATYNFATQNPGVDATTPITNADISLDVDTRVLTIVPPLGYFNIFVDGGGIITRFRKVGTINFPAFTNTSGMWYFYFDVTGTAVTTQTPWTIEDFQENVPIYRILWNATLYNFTINSANVVEGDTYTNNGQTFTVRQTYTGSTLVKMTGTGDPAASGNLVRATGTGTDPLVFSAWNVSARPVAQYIEYHLNDISADTHAWFHLQGAQWATGLTIASNAKGTGTPNANGSETVIALSSGTVLDDNLEYSITNDSTPTDPWQQDLGDTTPATLTSSNSALMTTFRQRADGTIAFRDTTRFPFDWNTTTNIPNYITALGVRTPVSDKSFFVYFVYITQNPKAEEAVKLVSATTEYSTIALARAFTWTDIQNTYSILNDGEVRPLYRLIFEYRTSYNVGAKYSVLRETQDLRKAAVTTTTVATGSLPATSVTNVPYSTTGATNVQSAIDELTDEKLNINQTSSQTISGGQPIQDTLTASELVSTDASKKLSSLAVATYPSLAELAYVKGVTSGIQSQINGKASTTHASTHAVGAADTVFPADPNADKYLMWDDDPGQLVWADAGGGAPEGTAVLSTGEAGGTKFLREDGDGTCSWQTVSATLLSDADYNTKGGTDAGKNLVSGAQYNTYYGYQAGISSALTDNGADNNTGVGYQTLYSNKGGYQNIAIGNSVLYTCTYGIGNTGIGYNALNKSTGGGIDFNTAIGHSALNKSINGYNNTAIGSNSLLNITSGYSNVAIGSDAGSQTSVPGANQTSNSSIYIGRDTQSSANGNTNEIVIGNAAIGVGSNTAVIGNSSVTAVYLGSSTGAAKLVTSSIELGAASDTSITRVGAGQLAIEGANIVTVSSVDSITGAKTFDKDKLLVKGTSTGTTNLTTANTSSTSYTATFPAKDGTVAMTTDITSGLTWSAKTANETMTVDTGTLANKGTLLELTLPTTSAVGKVLRIAGMNAGLWKVVQGANQYIKFGDTTSTTGATGYISSTLTYDAVEMVCIEADKGWVVVSSMGEITIA